MSNGKQGTWVTLNEGVMVLRLWEAIGPKEFHVALLQLSSARYKEFNNNPKQFLTDYDIFYTKELKQALKEVTSTELVSPSDDKRSSNTYMLMLDHDWNVCNTLAAKVRLFEPPLEKYSVPKTSRPGRG